MRGMARQQAVEAGRRRGQVGRVEVVEDAAEVAGERREARDVARPELRDGGGIALEQAGERRGAPVLQRRAR